MPTIVPLTAAHDRLQFDCGKPSLNDFLQKFASQYEKKRIGRTFVLVEPPAIQVMGYYTLSSAEVSLDELPEAQAKKLPRHPVPVVRLGRLAVDQTAHGKGYGAILLVDAPTRCLGLAEQVGVYALLIDALDERAAAFYAKYGFLTTKQNPLQLFLPLDTFAKAQAASQPG